MEYLNENILQQTVEILCLFGQNVRARLARWIGHSIRDESLRLFQRSDRLRGREEYQFAKEVADSRELDDFFTPIFVNSPDTEIAKELLDYHGLMIDSTDQITTENKDLDSYLSTIVTGVLPRI